MTDVPSVGWRGVYRWCGVSPSLEQQEEVVGRGFDPPDSMSYEKTIIEIAAQLFRSGSRRDTYVGIVFLVGLGVILAIHEKRENSTSPRFEKRE